MDNRFYFWNPVPNPENGGKEPSKWDFLILTLAIIATGAIFLYVTNPLK